MTGQGRGGSGPRVAEGDDERVVEVQGPAGLAHRFGWSFARRMADTHRLVIVEADFAGLYN